MKAKELMIVDWVRHSNGTPMRVTDIKENCFACGFSSCWSYNHEYSPIKLTHEILEKNGWHFDDLSNEWYSNNKAPNLYGRDCGNLSMFDGSVVVGNVHELQHALRLCGLNELADNFQV